MQFRLRGCRAGLAALAAVLPLSGAPAAYAADWVVRADFPHMKAWIDRDSFSVQGGILSVQNIVLDVNNAIYAWDQSSYDCADGSLVEIALLSTKDDREGAKWQVPPVRCDPNGAEGPWRIPFKRRQVANSGRRRASV